MPLDAHADTDAVVHAETQRLTVAKERSEVSGDDGHWAKFQAKTPVRQRFLSFTVFE